MGSAGRSLTRYKGFCKAGEGQAPAECWIWASPHDPSAAIEEPEPMAPTPLPRTRLLCSGNPVLKFPVWAR